MEEPLYLDRGAVCGVESLGTSKKKKTIFFSLSRSLFGQQYGLISILGPFIIPLDVPHPGYVLLGSGGHRCCP